VPLIIYNPALKKNGDVSDMVLNIDVTKTILDIAGMDPPDEYQGISLVPYLKNKKPELLREAILFEHLWKLPQIPSSEGIRTEKWKYFRYRYIDTPEELYDLGNDPLETNNLSQDPAFSSILDQLRKECDRQIEKYCKARLANTNNPEKVSL